MRNLFLLLSIALVSPQAFATGGVSCQVKDQNMDFEFSGVLSHSIPSGPFQVQGALTIHGSEGEIANHLMELKDYAQFWLNGDELKLRIYLEPEFTKVHSFVDLIIEAKYLGDSADEETHAGTYELAVHSADGISGVKKSGLIRCSIE